MSDSLYQYTEIPGGEVQFHIRLSGDWPLATIMALEMTHVSAPMPSINLKQAIKSLHDGYLAAGNDAELWPHFDPYCGGHVDLMLGIRYAAYFLAVIHKMDSGLTAFRSEFQGNSGQSERLIAGLHPSWKSDLAALGIAHLVNSVCDLSVSQDVPLSII